MHFQANLTKEIMAARKLRFITRLSIHLLTHTNDMGKLTSLVTKANNNQWGSQESMIRGAE
jgi:hypothetical protein